MTTADHGMKTKWSTKKTITALQTKTMGTSHRNGMKARMNKNTVNDNRL